MTTEHHAAPSAPRTADLPEPQPDGEHGDSEAGVAIAWKTFKITMIGAVLYVAAVRLYVF